MVEGKIWGNTTEIFKDDNVEVHLIRTVKGGFCSWHKHEYKHNMFYVISGKIEVVIDKDHCFDRTVLTDGTATSVAPNLVHQFRSHEDSIAIEIYWKNKINKSDIVRFTNGGVVLPEDFKDIEKYG